MGREISELQQLVPKRKFIMDGELINNRYVATVVVLVSS